jgi:predicted Zn-dependent peptidase
MKQFTLNNGMTVVYAGHSRKYSACLSVNVGHVNEPKLGIANLFERTLLQQLRHIIPVFGGTMTAYSTGGNTVDEVMEKLLQIFINTEITEEFVTSAKNLIIEQTNDIAPMTMRRMKLAYKHVAFGADLVKPTEEYLNAISSYTVEDVKEFANKYYSAKNIVLIISGPKVTDLQLKTTAEEFFGHLASGEPNPSVKGNIYTGGFEKLTVTDNTTRLMFGWDIAHLNIDDSPRANVMMSMFLRRLERAYADAGYSDVQVDFKIAGYYGLRTMRAYVSSTTHNAIELTDIFIKVVNRICDTQASDRRMERSRNLAMTEKLDKYEKSDDRALETAWQMIGRGCMYNVANRINLIYETTAEDVQDLAEKVFRGSYPTYIVALPETSNELYSYEDLVKALNYKDEVNI